MKKKDFERKLCVELLAGLKEFIEMIHFEKAFDEILQSLPDLCCDIPKAAEFTGYFLAQGISNFISMGYITPEKLNNYDIPLHMVEGLLAQYFKTLLQKDLQLLKTSYQPFSHSLQNFVKDKERFLQTHGLLGVLGEEPQRIPEPEEEEEPTERIEEHEEGQLEPVPSELPESVQRGQLSVDAEIDKENTTPVPETEPQPQPETPVTEASSKKRDLNNKTKGKKKKQPPKKPNRHNNKIYNNM